MRLPRLDTEFSLKHRIQMRVMSFVGRRAVPDVVKLHMYRHAFFGKHLGALFQEAMRGPSTWSIFDREIMAAFVSQLNQCVF